MNGWRLFGWKERQRALRSCVPRKGALGKFSLTGSFDAAELLTLPYSTR